MNQLLLSPILLQSVVFLAFLGFLVFSELVFL